MSESLLSFSEVLLFGRLIHDIEILETVKVHVATEVSGASVPPIADDKIDGVKVKDGDLALVVTGSTSVSGIYSVVDDNNTLKLDSRATIKHNQFVFVRRGNELGKTYWRQKNDELVHQEFVKKGKRRKGKGNNNFLGDQFGDDSQLARIYGFAYEGTYFELPEPCLFLVHGKGEKAAADSGAMARSPLEPSKSGVAAADYQVADDIRVWDYDKADYTIRMDVLTGQFEQVLLDIYFGFDSPAISGAKVSGAKVSGAKVSGAKVSGAKVSGAKVSGAKVRGGD
ncbi:pentapeptide repeat-containing protein [Ruegeria arenilitoris]|uniref:pentapeptide repeat-containing protein n=1 Tax=Ruegeria arenilitoris TaxID=1173585 RepID=UPI00147B067F|nr:pentapeptide repeat-containing protein [Ruegeria arenilitoris]